MGFGGINAHVVLESIAGPPAYGPERDERSLLGSSQDAELFLLGGRDVGRPAPSGRRAAGDRRAALAGRADRPGRAPGSGRSTIGRSAPRSWPADRPSWRPGSNRCGTCCDQRPAGRHRPRPASSSARASPRPGSGSCSPARGSTATPRWRCLEPAVPAGGAALPAARASPTTGDPRSTAVAQPAIIAASLAALAVLGDLGIEADDRRRPQPGRAGRAALGGGHRLPESLLRIAAARGRAMAELPDDDGAMAGVEADQVEIEALLNGDPVVIAGFNAPRQTVISGPAGGRRGGHGSRPPPRVVHDPPGRLARVPFADGGRGRRRAGRRARPASRSAGRDGRSSRA